MIQFENYRFNFDNGQLGTVVLFCSYRFLLIAESEVKMCIAIEWVIKELN